MADVPTAPTTCLYCLAALGADEAKTSCPACHAAYHQECWDENKGCAVYGCAHAPVAEIRRAIEVPVSYWGREQKPCPSCGKEILAAALRCRHCGATFASARPEDEAEFRLREAIMAAQPEVRRTVLWIFVLSCVPFLAPAGAVWGLCWYPSNRELVAALPPIYRALAKISLIISIAFTASIVVLTVLYVAVRGH